MGPIKAARKQLYDYTRIPLFREYLRGKKRPTALFLWIPKTAGTSMYNALHVLKLLTVQKVKYCFPGNGIVTFGHMDYLELIRQGYVSEEYDQRAYKFAFVRNPYDRAVSLYHYLKKARRVSQECSFLDFLRILEKDGCEPIGLYNSVGLNQCNPQLRWLENINVDFLGQFENLESDTQKLFGRLGIDAQLPSLNKSQRSSYLDYYCAESRQIVEHFYREDFTHFGYSLISPSH